MITRVVIDNKLESVTIEGMQVVNSQLNLMPTLTPGKVDQGLNPNMIRDAESNVLRPVTDEDILDNPYAGMG